MKYNYKQLYEKSKEFYDNRPKAKKWLIKSNLFLTGFFMLAYLGLILYVLFGIGEKKEIFLVFFLPALGFLLVNLLRYFIDKPRPYNPNGAGITPFIQKKKADNKSFPSRHTACAFVIATTFLVLFPWLGGVMLLFAISLAYVRFALGLHYPSDLTAGALVGLLSGLIGIFF